MSEDRIPYGASAPISATDADELRHLIEASGLTQAAAARELGYTDRSIRSFCSGAEPVPPAVLYAMRWILEHQPNRERYLQVHWKKLGLTVGGRDSFRSEFDGTYLAVWHNNAKVFYQPVESLLDQGVISIHASYSSDRFPIEWPPANGDYATKLHQTYGFVGFRMFTAPGAAPATQLFTADGKTMLSGRLRTWDEIDNAEAILVNGVHQAAEAARQAMAKAGAS